MRAEDLIALVEAYFAAVDSEDIAGVLDTLSPDCVFTVETHGVRLCGRDAISAMLHRLWNNHLAVRHYDFVHVPYPSKGRIATRFQVENTGLDGRLTHKSNCNFFEVADGRFRAVAVYMAGPNTLERAGN